MIDAHFDTDRIIKSISDQAGTRPKIAVVGDFCLDKYFYRDSSLNELSVETGLTAWQIRKTAIYPGAAGTVAANLAALGAEVFCFGLIGEDGEGFDLTRALKRIGCNTSSLVVSDTVVTNTYIKPMTQKSDRWVEMNRIDLRNSCPAASALVEKIADELESGMPQFSGVVVSDQFTFESGSILTDAFRTRLAAFADRWPETTMLVDSRSHLEEYYGLMSKANASEMIACFRRALSKEIENIQPEENIAVFENELIAAGNWLAKRNGRDVLITLGKHGSILVKESGIGIKIPGIKVRSPIDICGAGDATNAGFVFSRAIGLTPEESAFVAGIVSSITIQQIGVTGTASISSIIDTLQQYKPKFS